MTGTSQRERWVLFGLLSLATSVRVVCWAMRPDFWGDESALAMNISPKSLSEIGRPYVFWQICPWLFLVVAKIFALIFGDNEHALRLLPLLGGVAVPPLIYAATTSIAGRRAGLIALALAALSPRLVFYSTELKPYSTDAALAAASLALTAALIGTRSAPQDPRTQVPHSRRMQLGLIAVGALGVWMSLPLIFVLAGCGLSLALQEMTTRRRPAVMAFLGLAALLWCGGFQLHLTEFISKGSIAESSGVASFWSDGFMPFPPQSLAELRWLPGKFFWAFHDPGGYHLWLRYPVGLLFLFGLMILWRRNRLWFTACVAPLLLLLIASALHQYPMLGRLIVFVLPILIAVLAVAFDALADRSLPAVLATLVVLHAHPLLSTLEQMQPRTELGIEDFADRLAREPREGDGLYIDDTTKYAYLFYEWKQPPAIAPIDTESVGLIGPVVGWEHPYLDQLHPLFGKERVYVVLSTFVIPKEQVYWDDFITRYLDDRGGVPIEEVRSSDFLFVIYDLTEARP